MITKKLNYAGYQGSCLERKIKERLEKRGLRGKSFGHPWVTLITETLQRVNKELEKSQYFFSDIKKEGIMLYDSGKFKLSEPKDLSWQEGKEIAKDYFDNWFDEGENFLMNTYYNIQRNKLNNAASKELRN